LIVEDDKDLNASWPKRWWSKVMSFDRAHDGEEGHFLGDTEPYDA